MGSSKLMAGSLALLTDLYELTMMQGYFYCRRDRAAVFDMVFRRMPFDGGYCVFAGLETFVTALQGLRFTDDDLAYLRSLGLFREEFLAYLSRFSFRGDIFAVEEGEVVFAREPLVRVHATLLEAQFLESLLLNILNFQTLIATKTARIADAAQGRSILEFGLRRAQGNDGALSASRAAYVGGAAATSNVLAARRFAIPAAGTMAHSWVMSFPSEQEAFDAYARLYPAATVLLVDTYDTLSSGMPAAVRVLRRLKRRGSRSYGIRLDSGDLEYLSKKARQMLDRAGLEEAKIAASNELDEHVIEELMNKKAPIDYFGVGTKLVTAAGSPALDGIYKLVAQKERGRCVPRVKLSNNPEKMTYPAVKNVLRIYDDQSSPLGDVIFPENGRSALLRRAGRRRPLTLYHPDYRFENVTLSAYRESRVLLRQIMKNGALVYRFPPLAAVRDKARTAVAQLHPSYRRLLNPHAYKVSVTRSLFELRARAVASVSRAVQRSRNAHKGEEP